jgi:hypothetical protein
LDVTLTFGDDDDERVVTFEPSGGSWAARRDTLASLTGTQAA